MIDPNAVLAPSTHYGGLTSAASRRFPVSVGSEGKSALYLTKGKVRPSQRQFVHGNAS